MNDLILFLLKTLLLKYSYTEIKLEQIEVKQIVKNTNLNSNSKKLVQFCLKFPISQFQLNLSNLIPYY